MTETEFLQTTEKLFDDIEDAVEAGLDADIMREGNVLEIEADSGEKVVVNRHVPTSQVWLASRLGGRHFIAKDGQWVDTRTGEDLWTKLQEALSAAEGRRVTLPVR